MNFYSIGLSNHTPKEFQTNPDWNGIMSAIRLGLQGKLSRKETEGLLNKYGRSLPPAQQLELWLSIPGEEQGRLLLQYGLDVDVRHADGTPLVHFVAQFTDINGVLNEPVFSASHRQTLEALLACGADPTISCLYLPESCTNALQLNRHPEIRQILENHLNPLKG